MDSSYAESDVSMSPSKILEKLQILRQIQLQQRGKLEKQQLLFQETTETTSGITELVSHFSSSPSYNTFRSLLESPRSSFEHTPRLSDGSFPQKVKERDLIDGVSLLNISQETEFMQNSPTSVQSRPSTTSANHSNVSHRSDTVAYSKKHISFDDMPILQPKKDFEALIQEKLKSDSTTEGRKKSNTLLSNKNTKKSFLRKGEGMSRFGINKKNLVVQTTKSLPWLQKYSTRNSCGSTLVKSLKNSSNNSKKNVNIKENFLNKDSLNSNNVSKLAIARENPQIVTEKKEYKNENIDKSKSNTALIKDNSKFLDKDDISINVKPHNSSSDKQQLANSFKFEVTKEKHPILQNKSKTWAAVFTNEQNDFLRQLKQSEYYKNFASPCKSIVSDTSCNESLVKLRHDREATEQNMFDLLEKKVSHESFSLENSFFSRFLRKNDKKKLECSGESTPLVMQKVLANNPNLIHIFPDLNERKTENYYNEGETCNSEYTDCCSDCCTSEVVCCNCEECKGNYEINNTCIHPDTKMNNSGQKEKKSILKNKKLTNHRCENEVSCKNDNNTDQKNLTNEQNNVLQVHMAEMNEKLAATSILLKDRLRELEDEIETFRKENANLTKMREEVDLERQKFYEDKQAFEQKFNEEKILSEYYLSEEKEKLTKQKQIYERYVREIRGRLNKKEKDEVIKLKKEINDLKDEMRLKDAKSTSTIARLRNQLKIMEKEKNDYQDEIQKLKKEVTRIQHSNDITRRLTNIKYLDEINKKLSKINNSAKSDSDVKYKSFEIERQSRSRKVQQNPNIKRPRAKSVPNLNVTSRYAKYFSQRDILSDKAKVDMVNVESHNCSMDNVSLCSSSNASDKIASENESEGTLEKKYLERFKKTSPTTSTSFKDKNYSSKSTHNELADEFFMQHSVLQSNRDSNSSNQTLFPSSNISSRSNSFTSKSPNTVLGRNYSSGQSNASNDLLESEHLTNNSARSLSPHLRMSKSPVSILSNRSLGSKTTSIQQEMCDNKKMSVSPEPMVSKTNLIKTNLSPAEIYELDGSKEIIFPNGNKKFVSADGQYSKFSYYNGDIKENFFNDGRIKYFYSQTKTYHTTHADGLEVIEFSDGQVEKRYKDGSSEIRLPNGSFRYFDPKNKHVREEWRFPDGTTVTVSASGEKRIVFPNGQVEVHANDHKRREYPDGSVKLVYTDGTSETRYSSGRVRIKDKHGNLIMDSAAT